MKILLQRVKNANVKVKQNIVGEINNGFLLFLGIGKNDSESDIKFLIDKIINLRIFEDENDKLNLSLKDVNGDCLIVSQFTLYADCSKGRRPSFTDAMPPTDAKKMYELFIEKMENTYKSEGMAGKVASGKFGAMMEVELVNDGPVTIMLESNVELRMANVE